MLRYLDSTMDVVPSVGLVLAVLAVFVLHHSETSLQAFPGRVLMCKANHKPNSYTESGRMSESAIATYFVTCLEVLSTLQK